MYSKFLKITRLITHEDKLHLHKISGVIVLSSFLTRALWLLTWNSPTMSEPTFWNILTLSAHCIMLLSALQFKLAQRRFISSRSMEYIEMRLHTILFSLRSLAAILLCWLYQYDDRLLLLNVVLWHTLADIVTFYHGDVKNGTTVRGGDTPGWTKLFASTSQLLATSVMLGGAGPKYLLLEDGLYFAMMPIQINTFLMTLGRKDLISSHTKAVCYGFSLALLYPMFLQNVTWNFIGIVVGMVIWRLQLGLSKHIMWLLVHLALKIVY